MLRKVISFDMIAKKLKCNNDMSTVAVAVTISSSPRAYP